LIFLTTNLGLDFTGFPERTLLKVTKIEKIKERKVALNQFMNYLLKNLHAKKLYELLDFLQVYTYVSSSKVKSKRLLTDSMSMDYTPDELKILEC
jgi:predicted transposase YdaD